MEQRDNTFVLFRNKEKKHPNGPDFSGHATVNGQAMFIDAWEKDAGRGIFFSGALKNKQPKGERHEPDDLSDTIPF